MLIIPPPKYRRRRRVESAAASPPSSPPPPPPPVAVVSVQLIDSTTVLWTFNRTVVDPGDTDGYMAGGWTPIDQGGFTGDTITLLYPDVVSIGDIWETDPGAITTVFDPPGTLAGQDGTVS